MEATRFNIEKFDGITNFNLWQVRMSAMLIESDLDRILAKRKPNNMEQSEYDKLDKNGHLLSKDTLCNEFGSNSKLDRQASILVASRKQDPKYRYCKKLGYIKADCYKLRNKRATESNEEDLASANLAYDKGQNKFDVLTRKRHRPNDATTDVPMRRDISSRRGDVLCNFSVFFSQLNFVLVYHLNSN
ncbi:hypothetical protein PVK06_024346 [Gossypium arboreum]|uniref:Retrovirus-related Pol polyprotein from transposon TNT 1-94 n=1 Tax=Gossypium arboreum TaxID=29729 RepID=A0ABR0PDQ8_GOSAR|nr:hypothetical protein PVK06_024346 [Gossypium arboreum]